MDCTTEGEKPDDLESTNDLFENTKTTSSMRRSSVVRHTWVRRSTDFPNPERLLNDRDALLVSRVLREVSHTFVIYHHFS